MAYMFNLNNPDHWQQRAEEARVQAEQMTSEEARRAMLGVARDYEILAARAAERIARAPRT